MARGDIPYARFECNLFAHAIIGMLSPDELAVWFKLHLYAVHERRETLEFPPYSWGNLAKICGFSAGKTLNICKILAAKSPSKPLLMVGETFLTICGARLKNKGLVFKDAPRGDKAVPTFPYGSGSGSGSGNDDVQEGKPSGMAAWVDVAVELTGRRLWTDNRRDACLADAKALAEHHGDEWETANATLSALKGGIIYPSKLLQTAVEAIGKRAPETVEEQAARLGREAS